MSDVVVIGGGLAGALAALHASDGGAEVALVTGAEGATARSSGVWDLSGSHRLGFAAERSLAEHAEPKAAPLAGAHTQALAQARRLLGEEGLSLHEAGPMPLLVTELGVARRAPAHDPLQLDLSRMAGARIAVASLSGHPSFDARMVARQLDAQAVREGDRRRFAALEIDFVRRARDRLLLPHELAAVLDPDGGAPEGQSAREVLAHAIERALGGVSFDAVLFPPILGLRSFDLARVLGARIGRPVGEVVGLLPGAAGLRLALRLRAALERHGVRLIEGRARSVKPTADGLEVKHDGGKSSAAALVIATGRLLGGGLRSTSSELEETLLDAELTLSGEPLKKGMDVAGVRAGLSLGPDRRVRGLPKALAGRPIFACGSVLDGIDGTGAESGMVEVAKSALAASAAALSSLRRAKV